MRPVIRCDRFECPVMPKYVDPRRSPPEFCVVRKLRIALLPEARRERRLSQIAAGAMLQPHSRQTALRAAKYPPHGTRAFLRSASPITRLKMGLAARLRRASALGK